MAASNTTEQLGPASEEHEPNGLPWKLRVEDPVNRFVHYPLARRLVRALVHTPITPNQITLVQPLLAALAGYLIAMGQPRTIVLAVVVYELRSLLDCVDGTLARAKNMASANGHALDALADWLSAVFLFIGIYFYFRLHPPAAGAWTGYLSVGWAVALSLLHGAVRSWAADHYLHKLGAIFDRGRDESVESVRDKLLAIRSDKSIPALWEAWIAWAGHLTFELERFDPKRSRPLNPDAVAALQQARDEPLTRFVAGLWSISNGDFWITATLASALLGVLWPSVVFFSTAGFVWVVAVVLFNAWYIRRMAARADLVTV